MSNHELILLSPYRLPTHHSLYLADEDVAAFLNGLAVLWHPAALRDAVGPPRVASPYDHETPQPNCIYATPRTSAIAPARRLVSSRQRSRFHRVQGFRRPRRHSEQSQRRPPFARSTTIR